MLIFEIFVSLWLNEFDGCVTLQDPNFVTITYFFQLPSHHRHPQSWYLEKNIKVSLKKYEKII